MRMHELLKIIRKIHFMNGRQVSNPPGCHAWALLHAEAGETEVTEKMIQGYAAAFDVPVSSLFVILESINKNQTAPHSALPSKAALLWEWLHESGIVEKYRRREGVFECRHSS